ncbi:hypothetical protein H4582DRAFT_1919056 [Lactarius indigo]|nr:hypothetical protein H4582DRAFT_1919056 [Lactarius indigo]
MSTTTYRLGSLSTTAFATCVLVLLIYVLSIVVNQLYTGMHGFMGCSVGMIISWLLQHLVMPEVEKWVQGSDWSAHLVVTVVCLLLVNQHPSPVDDCPCFEDAYRIRLALDSPAAITTWVLFALLKLVTGVLIIFSWRIIAKPSMQTPATATVPLACVDEPRPSAAPAALHACDRICAWPTTYAAGGAEYVRPGLGCRSSRGRGCWRRERTTWAKLRRSSAVRVPFGIRAGEGCHV